MPKYEWYFLNKDDDVSICKHVTYKITFITYICAHSRFIHGPKHFFKINVD